MRFWGVIFGSMIRRREFCASIFGIPVDAGVEFSTMTELGTILLDLLRGLIMKFKIHFVLHLISSLENVKK